MPESKVEEGKEVKDPEEVQVGADGKHPETVSWTQYVGLKEKLGKKERVWSETEAGYKQKVSSLEEQIKTAPSKEAHEALVNELKSLKDSHKVVSDELNTYKNQKLSEKRETLKSKGGFTDEEIAKMSEAEMNVALRVLDKTKPKSDPGGGGGAPVSKSPREAIKSGFDTLHPNDK